MKWEEYKPGSSMIVRQKYESTDIECPICGRPLWRRTDIVLTTDPPKYKYECLSCGFIGAK